MPEYYYPERMGRIILSALDEVTGPEGARSLRQQASFELPADREADGISDQPIRFQTISRLMQVLEGTYGLLGGRGMALQIGRSCFSYGLREYGAKLGLTGTAFRLLPLPVKVRPGAAARADLFNRNTDQRVRLEDQKDRLLWHIERCPLCWERHSQEPTCHLAVGLLQESLYWLSGGKLFSVEEVCCIAMGASDCTIAIGKTPIS